MAAVPNPAKKTAKGRMVLTMPVRVHGLVEMRARGLPDWKTVKGVDGVIGTAGMR
jgi:hypothetical protein